MSQKFGRYKAGTCAFHGLPDFLALCSQAMEQLQVLDDQVFQSIEKEHLTFFYDPKGQNVFYKHFGIPEYYIRFREQGIIACVVFTHFEAQLADDWQMWHPIMTKPLSIRQKIYDATRAWLEAKGFPTELVAGFNCPASERYP